MAFNMALGLNGNYFQLQPSFSYSVRQKDEKYQRWQQLFLVDFNV